MHRTATLLLFALLLAPLAAANSMKPSTFLTLIRPIMKMFLSTLCTLTPP